MKQLIEFFVIYLCSTYVKEILLVFDKMSMNETIYMIFVT